MPQLRYLNRMTDRRQSRVATLGLADGWTSDTAMNVALAARGGLSDKAVFNARLKTFRCRWPACPEPAE